MVREDLVEGAISFLQDPSVASAPLEQRIAFLRSKNLTQDEIDTSLARVGQSPPPGSSSQPPTQYRAPPQQYNNYNGNYGSQPYGAWQQPPPEPPRRDWRDYFIAATVASGIGYGLYWTAKRYVYPLIAPPTPPQLEQDKKSVDEAFEKTFQLLEQLSADTAELKNAEAQRKERLDAALSEVESVIGRMKLANDEREQEAKRNARELSELRDLIPKAIEKEKQAQEERLKELGTEMKSLKTLVQNRMRDGGAAPSRTTPSFSSSQGHSGQVLGSGAQVNGNSSAPAVQEAATNGVSTPSAETKPSSPYTAPASTSTSSNPYQSRLLGNSGGKAAIPAWQLAAKKKSEDAKAAAAAEGASGSSTPNVQESGTVQDAADGPA
ncbi:Putative peroxisomal membrane protein [Septoria linicola]|uniref:Peroxisomal membrane protein PEX14 n=1 Tax=Septoria linicola TaxID=215465 RepID=A0A9Q9B118_9PEZI|nr:putative peroxisomal membrane protein [Septoria linicola]USW55633.1 Putative peroxisomal membrane protein [Septoria linicola]